MKDLETIVHVCHSENFIMHENLNGLRVCSVPYKDVAGACKYISEEITLVGKNTYHVCKAIPENNTTQKIRDHWEIQTKLLNEVLVVAKDNGIDGSVLWLEYYKKEPSYRHHNEPDYYILMRQKYQKVHDLCMAEIGKRIISREEK